MSTQALIYDRISLSDILNMKVYDYSLPYSAREVAKTMPIDNERRVLDGLQDLDPQVIGDIYDQYFSEVYRYVCYRISDETVAEDIASEVFVRLLEAAQNHKGPQSSIKGWLIATASNAVNDHLRLLYRRPTEELSDSLPDENSSITFELDLREQNRVLHSAYTQLTAEQQHVLALRFGLGYSLEETATQLKKKVNAIKALQFRALASLQRQIGEGNHE
ncbi:MAG: sigma-70 family RNA polymerase sigma factor [Chloroflexota bacterium]